MQHMGSEQGFLATRQSEHARMRSRQRGVRQEVLDFVLNNYDGGCFIGDGRRSAFITRRRLLLLHDQGVQPAQLERAKGIILILGGVSGGVVTAMHWQPRHGARYTRQFPTRSTRDTA